VENLQKLRIEEEKLGPAGTEFLHFLDDLEPQLKDLQNLARAGLFPGVEEGIDSLLTRLPLVRQTVNRVSQELGRLAADAGSALASDEWTPFFNYIRTNAAPILDDFARSTGNVALAFANILVAFNPLSRGFTGGLEEMTARFAEWSKTLDTNQGFQDFLDTVREAGPELEDFAGSTIQLLAGVAKASAPLGEVTLPILTGILKVLAAIANSDAGPSLYAAAAGLIALNRAASSKAVTSLSSAFLDLRTSPNLAATAIQRFGGVAKLAAGAGGMALFVNSLHESNQGLRSLEGAAGGALAGFSVGGPWGAAIGGAIGLVVSLGSAHKQTAEEVQAFTETLDKETGALTLNSEQFAYNALNATNAYGAAKTLGIGLDLVTQAALGNSEAYAAINEQLDKYINADLSTANDGGQSLALASTAQALRDSLDSTLGVVKDGKAAFDQQAEAIGNTTPKVNELKGAYDQATTAAAGLEAQLTELDNFLNKRGTFRAYQASLDALRESLKKGPADFSAFTDAGRQNLDDLDKIVTDAEAHLKTITDPSGKKQAGFLDDVIGQLRGIAKTSPAAAAAVHAVLPELQKVQDANKAIVIKANNADALKKAAETSEALHDLATSRTRPTISADASGAIGAINQVSTMLRNLNGDHATTYVRTVRTDIPLPGKADGGTIMGPRYPYGDKVLIHAAPGEEIISNRHGQADRFRADRAAGRIPAYASGGTVSGRPDSGGLDTPLFTGEGPRFYKAAYKHNKPFAVDPRDPRWPYQTPLTKALELAFEDWANNNPVHFDPSAHIVDYDMRGFWKAKRPKGWHEGDHFPDTWKTPYDTTFSHESKYATKDNPFYWRGDKLVDIRTGQVVFAGADGATVPGGRYPYGDRVLTLTAPGEEIISNRFGQADRHRDLLKAISSNQLADGGTVADRIASTYTTRYRGSTSDQTSAEHQVTEAEKKHAEAAKAAAKALAKLQDRADAVSKAYDRQKSKLEGLISQRDSIASTVTSAALHDAFGNGVAGLDTQVEADTNDIEAMAAALATLVKNGLSPKSALYQQLAAHMDVNTAQQLAQLSSTDLATQAQRFQQRQDEAGALGLGVANDSGLAEAIGKSTKVTDKLEARLHSLEDAIRDMKHLPDQVHHATFTAAREGTRQGAEDGTRAGQDEKRRRTAAAGRTGSR
jgi:hypothetical protein